MRYAILKDENVVNVIEAEIAFIEESQINAILCPDQVSIGWTYVKGKFIEPPMIYAVADDDAT